MLCLSRKRGERIVINGNIIITVNRIGRQTVQLAIEAPKETPVHRHEIAELLKRQQPPGDA